MAPDFEKEKKSKAFVANLTGKETGGKVQICLPSPGFGARFKGFQHQIFLDNKISVSERVLVMSWPFKFMGFHKCFS